MQWPNWDVCAIPPLHLHHCLPCSTHQKLEPLCHFSDSPNPGRTTALVCAVWIQNKSLGISKWLLKATWSAGSVFPRLSRGSGGDVFKVAWQNTAGDKGVIPGKTPALLPKPAQASSLNLQQFHRLWLCAGGKEEEVRLPKLISFQVILLTQQSVPFRRTQIREVFGQGAVEGTPGQIRLSFGHFISSCWRKCSRPWPGVFLQKCVYKQVKDLQTDNH